MSVRNAMRMAEKVGDVVNYCLPLGIDCVTEADLPEEFYCLAKEAAKNKIAGSHNSVVGVFLREFYDVEPEVGTNMFPRATYNAFGADEQHYCPDVDYEYTEEAANFDNLPDPHKKFRLERLLKRASSLGCGILFFTRDTHVQSLQAIPDRNGVRFVARNYDLIQGNRLYSAEELSGLAAFYEPPAYTDERAPLPELEATYFPNGKSSWELLILPPK